MHVVVYAHMTPITSTFPSCAAALRRSGSLSQFFRRPRPRTFYHCFYAIVCSITFACVGYYL